MTTASPSPKAALSEVIRDFEPTHVMSVVSDVLRRRREVTGSAREALDSAISASVRIDGFRDASRARPEMLRQYVMEEFAVGNDRLIGAVLQAWMELRADLSGIVGRHLDERNIPVDGLNLGNGALDVSWVRDEWMDEVSAVVESAGDVDRDDAALMLCCVSGRTPFPVEGALRSPLLWDWIDRLRELPPDAPEWGEMQSFTEMALEIARDKVVELVISLTAELADALDSMGSEYERELGYLDLDLSSWAARAAERPSELSEATRLVEALRTDLSDYRLVLPQAPSRSEETLRAADRAEKEAAIFETVAAWERLTMPPDGAGGSPGEDERSAVSGSQLDGEPSPDADGSPDDGESERTVPTEKYEELLAERDRLRREGESLRSENERLVEANEGLESDRRLLDTENDSLRDDLAQSRQMEETWRDAYVSSRAARAGGEGEPSPPTSVSEAVARAGQSFPNRLVVALNSKSDKNSPFRKPQEVFDALAWLATVYYQRRVNPGRPAHFDTLLKESCSGWSYKPRQRNTAKGQFEEWYAAAVDGRTYQLDEHIGKGNTFDPQNTIRIAFAWDEERRLVVIGYVGLHQRNRRS